MSDDPTTISLTITVFEASRDEAVDVAVELFETFWRSKHLMNLDDITINGKSVINAVRDRYAKNIKAAPPA